MSYFFNFFFAFDFDEKRVGCKTGVCSPPTNSPFPYFSKTGYPGSERFFLHYADLIDFGSLCQLLR